MICKIPGNYLFIKLQIIQLLEADLNMYLRLVWGKRLVSNIIKFDKFPPEQGGNRPGYQGLSSALLKVLSFDKIRLLRAQATVFNNEAKACYNWVHLSFSQICWVRLGLPIPSARFLFHLLWTAQYYVNTFHRTDKQYFTNLLLIIFRVLQRSGLAPAIWLAVTVLLINTYNNEFHQQGIFDPTNTYQVNKLLDAFVEDTNLWDIITHPTTTYDLTSRMQTQASFWSSILTATGGKLNMSKCFWYLLTWQWNENGQPTLNTIPETPSKIIFHDTEGTPHQIKRVEPKDALRTLGVHTSPSWSPHAELNATKTKLKQMIQSIQQSHMTHNEASMLIPIYIHTKLRYTFSATCFTQKQCWELDRIFRGPILTRMGICCKISLSIIYSSFRHAGLQIPTSWDLQGSSHLHLFIGHVQIQDLVGRLITLLCNYVYLHLGIEDQGLSYDINIIKDILPKTWITTVWEYISSIQATITLKTLRLYPQREKDTAIMFHALPYAKGAACQRINAIHLYLCVFFISNITTSCGKQLDPDYVHQTPPTFAYTRTPILNWPNQQIPPKKAWQEWQRFLISTIANSNYCLCIPLGRWIFPSKTQRWL